MTRRGRRSPSPSCQAPRRPRRPTDATVRRWLAPPRRPWSARPPRPSPPAARIALREPGIGLPWPALPDRRLPVGASRTFFSTARSRRSSSAPRSRGTLPIASHLSPIARSAARAASRSEVSTFSASASSASLASAFARNSASRSALEALRAAKKVSCAPLNRCHSASSTSLAARPAAFHSVNRSRNAAPVAPQSVEPDSSSARSHSASLACRAPARSRSSSAKCEPRRRLKVSRAVEYRFHSASSVLRSSPLMVRHSSRISRSRSPAAFHCVEFVARSSASAASVSLRAACAARYSSRFALSACAASSACSTMAVRRAASASTSPRTCASGRVSASAAAADLILRASPVPDSSRRSISATSVCRSSNRRPKCSNAASVSPACHEPMTRSPDPVISQTVPSGSTRPNRCGSLDTGAATVGAGRPGRGTGRGGPGRGAGLGVVDCPPGSLVVMSVTSYPPRGNPRTCRATRRLASSNAIQTGPRGLCPRLSRCICLRSSPTQREAVDG